MALPATPWKSRDGRLGILFVGIAMWQVLGILLMQSPELGGFPGASSTSDVALATAIGGGVFAIGLGLVFELRIARYVAALLLAVIAGATVWSQIGTFRDLATEVATNPWFEYTWAIVLTLASGVAFTLMVTWLSASMIAWLVARKALVPRFTVRLVAGAWLVVGMAHLMSFVQSLQQMSGFGGGDTIDTWKFAMGLSGLPIGSISLSTRGVVLAGFMLWPIWHAALAATCAGVIVAPARFWPRLGTVFFMLFAILVALSAYWASQAFMMVGIMLVSVVGATGILAYLAWWFRTEVNELTTASQ